MINKGAFTGAGAKGKPGKFELANKGTIFLDEIGDLPLEMQPKLLRVLEDKVFERIGGTRVIRSDFRVICATNRDLAEMMEKNRFRRDLFYRLNVILIHIAPLRERPADILPLARHMLKKIAKKAGQPALRIEKKAARLLNIHRTLPYKKMKNYGIGLAPRIGSPAQQRHQEYEAGHKEKQGSQKTHPVAGPDRGGQKKNC